MTANERNAIVLECVERVRPFLIHIASKSNLELDDLSQDAFIVAIEALGKIQELRNPHAYAIMAIRHHTFNLLRQKHPCISLDEPAHDERETPLAETLAATEPIPHDEVREDHRTCALYAALSRLPLEEQMYLRQVHAVNAYQPVLKIDRKPNYNRSKPSMSKSAYTRLRKDKELAREVLA